MNELKFSKEKQVGRKPIKHSEKSHDKEKFLQILEEELLKHMPDIAVIRIPDAAYRAIFANQTIHPRFKRDIAMFLRGIPDLILLRAMGDKYNIALCIENKVGKNQPTQGQKHFAARANVHIIKNFDDFEKLVNEFRKKGGCL